MPAALSSYWFLGGYNINAYDHLELSFVPVCYVCSYNCLGEVGHMTIT